jgi:hypothetical protein
MHVGTTPADPGGGDTAPHALRAIVRFAIADIAFIAASIPGPHAEAAAQLLVFLTGLAWVLPTERIPGFLRSRLPLDMIICSTCAVSTSAAASDWSDHRLIGAIERVIA